MTLHLRTLALACALCLGAALGGLAGRDGSVSAAQGEATGATLQSATRTADPFLAAAGPILELTAEKRSSGPLQLHRSPRPRLGSARHSSLPIAGIPPAPAAVQSWTERGRREHHLGTPPPSVAA